MGSGIYFPLSAILFNLLIMIMFFIRKHVDNVETKIFSVLIVSNLFGLIIEILCTYASYINEVNKILSVAILKSYLIYILLWISALTVYIFYVSKGNNYVMSKRVLFSFLALIAFSSIMICVLPIELVVSEDYAVRYTTGPSVKFTYFISSVYITAIIVMLLKNIKHLNNKKYLPIFTFLTIGIAAMFFQLTNPGYLLLTYVETFITVFMYHTIENPDVKMLEVLNESKIAAEKANRAKSEFLSNMSHEIRTPLNAIVGFSDCILEEDSLDDAKNDAKDIKLASENLLEIVNGILDISKIEADKMEIVETDYEPGEIINNTVKLVRPRIGEKPIVLTLTMAPDLPYLLHGDGGKLKQILTNILTNAVKYTEEGSVTVGVNCINEGNISKLVISVEDTGRGIKPEQIDKLFTKFQRLDEDRNTTLEGTGLGLAITKRLVEMMGGKIVVQSKYGEGSKFTVYLQQKIVTLNKPEEAVIKDITSLNRYNDIDFTQARVLVVDDNKINLKVAAKLLSNVGINAELVESGFSCLDLINNGAKYDLILLDDMMPKMSGVETLKKLKEIGSFNIPTVALTANAISGMKEKYLSDGFNDYLSKPIDKNELMRVLTEYLKK